MSDTDELCERADLTYAAILRLMEETAIRAEQTMAILNQSSVGQQQTLDLHLLLSPAVAGRLVAAGVDRDVRARERSSDHAPVWIELADADPLGGQGRPVVRDPSQRRR